MSGNEQRITSGSGRRSLSRRNSLPTWRWFQSRAIDTFLRVAYSLALLPAGALLVHAASLGRQGRAWLFPGPSGSGKTTLTRVSGDAEVLSDEISIVRVDAAGARCYGSPFFGDLGRPGANRALPLAAMHFLRHADRHVVSPLPARSVSGSAPLTTSVESPAASWSHSTSSLSFA